MRREYVEQSTCTCSNSTGSLFKGLYLVSMALQVSVSRTRLS